MLRIRRHRPPERLPPLDVQPRRHVGAGALGWQRGTCGDGGGLELPVGEGLGAFAELVRCEEAAGGVGMVVGGEAGGDGGRGGGGHGRMVGEDWVRVWAWKERWVRVLREILTGARAGKQRRKVSRGRGANACMFVVR